MKDSNVRVEGRLEPAWRDAVGLVDQMNVVSRKGLHDRLRIDGKSNEDRNEMPKKAKMITR